MDNAEPTKRPRRFTTEEKAEMVRLYTTPLDDGTWMGATAIGRLFGTSHRSVYYVLKRAGISTRNAREAHAHGKRCKPITRLPSGDPPACRCGCGERTAWNQKKDCWLAYAPGHYQRRRPYHDGDWLYEQYVVRRRTTAEIAAELSVTDGTISRALAAAGIPARDRSEARLGRMVGERNPAWKGGVAKWDYAAGWKAIARKIRYRDDWTCQGCGEQRSHWGRDLHVHHRDENKLNNDPANLISLCVDCHHAAHATKGGDA